MINIATTSRSSKYFWAHMVARMTDPERRINAKIGGMNSAVPSDLLRQKLVNTLIIGTYFAMYRSSVAQLL